MKAKVGSLKRSMGKKKKKAQETLALQWLSLGSSMAQGPSLAGGMHSMPKKEREREREREREKIQISNIRNKRGSTPTESTDLKGYKEIL